MPDLLAIISKSHFESSGEDPQLGARLRIDRYSSANRALKALADGGRLFLVTVRPPERLWLVGMLEQPKFDGQEWIAPAASELPIVDITYLRSRLTFASGKGIAAFGALGAALQTPRALSERDAILLEEALAAATTAAPPPTVADDPVALRRVDDRESLAHRIERGKSARAKCATCELPLAKDAVRVAEVYMHGDIRNPIFRYHHLACAVTAVPMVVRSALRAITEPELVPDRDAIAAQIDARLAELAAEKQARYAAKPAAPVSVAGDALIAQLADDPDDAATLGVLADELTAHDDPRGELITVQVALLTAKPDAAGPLDESPGSAGARSSAQRSGELIERRAELIRVLSPKLDPGDRMQWSVGFVRRVELVGKTAARMEELAGFWQHPSLALVRELRVEFHGARDGGPAIAGLVAVAPRSLERLEIGGNFDHQLGEVSALIAALPKLTSLAINGHADLGAIAHPTLASIDLASGFGVDDFARDIGQLLPKQLPAVRTLILRGPPPRTSYMPPASFTDVLTTIAARGWLRQAETFELTRCQLEAQDITALAAALGKKQLARLDIATCTVALNLRPALAALCTDLAFPAAAVIEGAAKATHAAHSGKPEWGIGKITSRRDGKIEINFGKKVGVKVFKADAPFLKLT